ncbi:MAG: type II toxin-antitoxin system VapC family toxin [Terracidiphilus sp.]|jgi:PIN domain nuclease of toxin-antitoxin system
MNYLLDTHTFVWILNTPEILTSRVQSIVEDRSSFLLISIATPWEMAIKVGSGKLDAANILDDFEAAISRGRFTFLETAVRQAIRGGRLPAHHRDPFDRLLAAQALDLNLPLISRDGIFDLYGVRRIWD